MEAAVPRYAPVTPRPDDGEQDARDEPAARLQHDAQPRRAIGARGLQEPALEAEEQPQAARDRHRGGRPFLVHVQQRRERRAGKHGRAGDTHGDGEQPRPPAREWSPTARRPMPSRPSAPSRAAATCSASPGTNRITLRFSSAASAP